jgi:hypothetical protein
MTNDINHTFLTFFLIIIIQCQATDIEFITLAYNRKLYFIRVISLQFLGFEMMMEATRGWKVASSLTWDLTSIPGFAAGFATDGL